MLQVKALHQLERRRESPGELAEELVLFVRSRGGRVGAGLTVVVAQVLIAGEEPEPLLPDGSAQVGREVVILVAFVAGAGPAGSRTGCAVRLEG